MRAPNKRGAFARRVPRGREDGPLVRGESWALHPPEFRRGRQTALLQSGVHLQERVAGERFEPAPIVDGAIGAAGQASDRPRSAKRLDYFGCGVKAHEKDQYSKIF